MADNPLLNEELCRLSALNTGLPTPPHASTRWRWANVGVRGVVLESLNIGGVTYTSVEAWRRFRDALNQPKPKPSPVKTIRSRKQRIASTEKAEAILAARGI